MSISMDVQRNKLMHLENTLVMLWNLQVLEKLVKTVQVIHSRQPLIEGLFTGQSAAAYEAYSQMHGQKPYSNYMINSM